MKEYFNVNVVQYSHTAILKKKLQTALFCISTKTHNKKNQTAEASSLFNTTGNIPLLLFHNAGANEITQ